jgi:hypothetical protein
VAPSRCTSTTSGASASRLTARAAQLAGCLTGTPLSRSDQRHRPDISSGPRRSTSGCRSRTRRSRPPERRPPGTTTFGASTVSRSAYAPFRRGCPESSRVADTRRAHPVVFSRRSRPATTSSGARGSRGRSAWPTWAASSTRPAVHPQEAPAAAQDRGRRGIRGDVRYLAVHPAEIGTKRVCYDDGTPSPTRNAPTFVMRSRCRDVRRSSVPDVPHLTRALARLQDEGHERPVLGDGRRPLSNCRSHVRVRPSVGM